MADEGNLVYAKEEKNLEGDPVKTALDGEADNMEAALKSSWSTALISASFQRSWFSQTKLVCWNKDNSVKMSFAFHSIFKVYVGNSTLCSMDKLVICYKKRDKSGKRDQGPVSSH